MLLATCTSDQWWPMMTLEDEIADLAKREVEAEVLWAKREVEREEAKKRPMEIGAPAIIIKHHAVDYKGSPVSKSLPRRDVKKGKADTVDGHPALRFSDGTCTNRQGQPIVLNRHDTENERSRTGMSRD